MDGLVQVNGGWELGLQSRLGVAWEGSTTIVCLPFSSVDAAPHLFRAGWLPEGLTAKCTQGNKANEPFSNEKCPFSGWVCLPRGVFGFWFSWYCPSIAERACPVPDCLSWRQRQSPTPTVSSPGKAPALGFLWREGINSLHLKIALSY